MRALSKLLVGGLVGVLVAAPDPAAAGLATERLAGDDRLASAVAVSRYGWEQSDVAVLATAGDYPDALSAGALAAQASAPVLLTPSGELADAVGAELERLGVERVLAVGGPQALSDEVIEAVEGLEARPSVQRLAGEDRFATAAAVAHRLATDDPGGGQSLFGATVTALSEVLLQAATDKSLSEAVVVAGGDFPDAVSAGALAVTGEGAPVLLTRSEELAADTAAVLEDLDVERVTLVGGTAAVDDGVEEDLRDADVEVERLAGDNRYTTSLEVAREAEERHGAALSTAVLATGSDYADALAAQALAARVDGLLVLSGPSDTQTPTSDFLADRSDGWERAVAVGGEEVLPSSQLEPLAQALRGGPVVAEVAAGEDDEGDPDADARAWQWPADGAVTSMFGPRDGRLHKGIDVGGAQGDPVRAVDAGTVTFAGAMSGYGSVVEIDHGDGVETLYAHLSSLAVSTGDAVSAGDHVGGMGCTGECTGTHLHFEVRVDGRPEDPRRHLP